jgi:prepilin-type N-terminal cleavage/methylation domain-containing protein
MRKKKGFSLVEVLVAAVIFSLLMLGMFSVFVSASKHITHARERMTSSQLGEFFIDPLQVYVRYDTWDQASNELRLTTAGTPRFGVTQSINNRNFSETHTVADGNPAGINYDAALAGTVLRRVTSTITWTEPSS